MNSLVAYHSLVHCFYLLLSVSGYCEEWGRNLGQEWVGMCNWDGRFVWLVTEKCLVTCALQSTAFIFFYLVTDIAKNREEIWDRNGSGCESGRVNLHS